MAQQSTGAYPASDGGKRSRGGQADGGSGEARTAGRLAARRRTAEARRTEQEQQEQRKKQAQPTKRAASQGGRGAEAPRTGSRPRGGGLANGRHAAAKPAGRADKLVGARSGGAERQPERAPARKRTTERSSTQPLKGQLFAKDWLLRNERSEASSAELFAKALSFAKRAGGVRQFRRPRPQPGPTLAARPPHW